jgi:hypothetical protein
MERPHAVSVRAPARTTTRVQPGLGVVARFRSARLASPRVPSAQHSGSSSARFGSPRVSSFGRTTGRFRVGYPQVLGLVGSGSGMISYPRFSGSGLQNQSGSVSGLVFHPWISEINHLELKLMFYNMLIIKFFYLDY